MKSIKARLAKLEQQQLEQVDRTGKYLGTAQLSAIVTAIEDGAQFNTIKARLDDLEQLNT